MANTVTITYDSEKEYQNHLNHVYNLERSNKRLTEQVQRIREEKNALIEENLMLRIKQIKVVQ